MSETKEHYFITYLQSLVERDDRGALASLRHGLGKKPGTTPEMYRYIVPLLPEDPPLWKEKSFYMIASLFASHPKSTDKGNLGNHMANACVDGNEEAFERRFTALLSAHTEDLPDYLRQTISLLKSKEVPVNWKQLLSDLQWWSHPEYGDRVRKNWATSFWGYRKEASSKENK